MKTLYWQTRSLRRTASGGRRAHWPGVALNLALAFALVTFAVGCLVLAGLEGDFTELFGLADALLPIIATWGLALTALGLGYRLTVPTDRLPGDAGEPPAQRTTRWCHWANLRAVLFGGLAAATVLAAAHTYSGWQGRRAWTAYRAEAEQRGVVFDLEKLMPPPVPDADNFAATPLLRPFQGGNPERAEHLEKLKRYSPANQNLLPDTPISLALSPTQRGKLPEDNMLLGKRTDLAAWQQHFQSSTNWTRWPEPRSPAEDVLKALTRYDAELSEMHAAAKRPKVRFNTKLSEDGVSTLIPHLSALKSIQQAVTLRSIASLAVGRTNDAFADAKLAFRLADTLKDEPILISHLVRLAAHRTALRTVWEGLADHRWTDAQLMHWHRELARYDFAAELRRAMAGERAFGNRAIEFISRNPRMLTNIDVSGERNVIASGGWSLHAIPPGWFYHEQASYNQIFDDYLGFVFVSPGQMGNGVVIRPNSRAIHDVFVRDGHPIQTTLRHRVLSRMLLPALENVPSVTSRAQTFTHLAAAACALERHWLARGSYPETLAALAPEFGPLPPDPMTGQPFRYERTADGRFRLWSLGWNGQDDGGTVALTGSPTSQNRNINFEQGDWVWPVPVK